MNFCRIRKCKHEISVFTQTERTGLSIICLLFQFNFRPHCILETSNKDIETFLLPKVKLIKKIVTCLIWRRSNLITANPLGYYTFRMRICFGNLLDNWPELSITYKSYQQYSPSTSNWDISHYSHRVSVRRSGGMFSIFPTNVSTGKLLDCAPSYYSYCLQNCNLTS